MTFYKVLTKNMQSGHNGVFDWTKYAQSHDWTPEIAEVSLCSTGYHLTTQPMQWPLVGMRVFEAEGRGAWETQEDQTAYASVRLLRECPEAVPAYWHDAEAFVAELPTLPWLQPQGDPDQGWRVFETRAAARDETRAAARDAARDAAWAAAWVAARDAAWAAAGDAAWVAARDAAWAAAGVAARDAAWAAALWARVLVVRDLLGDDSPHVQHAAARTDVWRRGYGLLCDVEGELYVYRKA
jgi:hypothetical protein